ncbi:MAG TPA: choice-of-anchor tandem repeat GloVer-containing protein [Rhizomicrobium sp.]
MSSLCHALRSCAAAKSHMPSLALATIAGCCLFAAPVLSAPAESVLYSFAGAPDGATPFGNLVLDAFGNLYGTTVWGGNYNSGTVFKVSPAGIETVLYSFKGGRDGQNPYGAVALDPAGNIYGVTAWGGKGCDDLGCGTVFELTPDGRGGWKETVLYRLNETREGEDSLGGLARDAQGNLYGTTAYGGNCAGASGAGTVFELSLVDSRWKSTVLSTFCKAGAGPVYGTLALDNAGYLYGTAGSVVFRLDNGDGKRWRQTALHDFSSDGYALLIGGITLDAAGNAYGANASGGTGCDGSGCGTIFELEAAKGWKAKTLYTFHGADGNTPFVAPVADSAGNLYGTTYSGGGCGGDCGVLYKLSPRAHGAWKETILHAFGNNQGDGYNPLAGVALDAAGNIFGVTTKGGGGDFRRCDCGAVYQIGAAHR